MYIIVHRAIGFHEGHNHVSWPITDVLQLVPAWLENLKPFCDALNAGSVEEVKFTNKEQDDKPEDAAPQLQAQEASDAEVEDGFETTKKHRGRPRKEESEQ